MHNKSRTLRVSPSHSAMSPLCVPNTSHRESADHTATFIWILLGLIRPFRRNLVHTPSAGLARLPYGVMMCFKCV
jgi:hypothetical protein